MEGPGVNGQTVPTGYASSTDILISFGPEDVARVAVGVALIVWGAAL